MNIIFVSRTCSEEEYTRINNLYNISVFSPSQIMYSSFLKGVSEVDRVAVTAISARMVDPKNAKFKMLHKMCETVNKIRFVYPNMWFIPRLSSVWAKLTVFFATLKTLISIGRRDTVVICDVLQLFSSSARAAARLVGVPIIGYATDLPNQLPQRINEELSCFTRILSDLRKKQLAKSMTNYDGYIILAPEMNRYINPHNKPFMIAECIVDSSVIAPDGKLKNDGDAPNIIMYAGSTNYSFGIRTLLDSMHYLKTANTELHIYGNGDYTKEIIELAQQDHRIKYYGVVSHEAVIRAEREVSVLVNPRPTDLEFTQVSFPSKTSEYMAAGCPVITTHLAGIPSEYDEFLWYIDDETPEGVARCIDSVLSLPSEVREQKALSAKQFIMDNKSSDVQGKRIIDYLKAFLKE